MNKEITESLELIGKSLECLAMLVEKGDTPGHPFRGNQFSGGGGGSSSHSVPLPKNPKKLNMDTAGRALREMGFEMKPAGFNMQSQQAEYHVTGPDGNTQRRSSREVRDMVYAGAKR